MDDLMDAPDSDGAVVSAAVLLPAPESRLVRYEAALHALAECKAVDEVKDLIDRAEAMRVYQRLAGDKTLEIDAAEIRLRAERRLGEMLLEQRETHGFNKGGNPNLPTGSSAEPVAKAPTLAEVGISKKLSSRAQKIASVPEHEFEAEVGDWRERVEAEGARVTARLEMAGERAQATQKPAKAAEAHAPAVDMAAENEALRARVDELEEAMEALDGLQQQNDKLCALVDMESDGAKMIADLQLRLNRCQATLRTTELSRDTYMRENAEMKRQIKQLMKGQANGK